MNTSLNLRSKQLLQNLQHALQAKISNAYSYVGEITIECNHDDLLTVATVLRDHTELKFEQLIDLCGVDYVHFSQEVDERVASTSSRFATVYHLLSVSLNHRVRLKVFAPDNDFPVLPTLVNIWPVANWFEREAFDLFGIMYDGHPDLRRLLTDYGFVGHPFRKDFPMIGNVEMRYDPDQQRVIYQPVSIELRNNVPRVIRAEGFHHG